MKKIILLFILIFFNTYLFAGKNTVPTLTDILSIEKIDFYSGLGITAISSRDSKTSMDIFHIHGNQDRLGDITLLIGDNLNEYVAFEFRYIRALQDEHRVEMSDISFFLKPQYRFKEDWTIYGLLGFGYVSLDAVNGNVANYNDTSFQFGGGITYDIIENIILFFDYIDLLSDANGLYWTGDKKVNVDGFTAGIIYKF